MKRLPFSMVVLPLVLLCWCGAMAQSGVTVSGVVEDPSGAVISGAKLSLSSKATGKIREAVADGAGQFSFKNVTPGEYSLRAEAAAFDLEEKAISVGSEPPPKALKMKMKISIQDEVTITGRRSAQATSPEQNADAVRFDEDLFRELPVDGQNILPLVGDFLSPAAQGTEGLSVLVDGVEGDRLNLPTWAVKRVLINRNPYSAEYRRPGKARVEVITQDGSRRHFHGGVALFARNSIFDARNPFARDRPDLHRRLLEASFSGPLPGKRLTFFASGERLIDDETAVVNAFTSAGPLVANVPTPQRRTNLLGRIDLRLNEIHTLSWRYDVADKTERNQGVGGFHLPEQAIDTAEREHRFQFSDRTIFSASLLNDLRVVFGLEGQRLGRPADTAAVVVKGAFTDGPPQTFREHHDTRFDFQDVTTYIRGSHTLRFGVEFHPRWIQVADQSNFGGTFEFSSLDQFTLMTPFVFRVNQGRPDVNFTQHEVFGFFQDEVKLRPDFNLMLGLRYGWQSNLDDHNNFAPRLAFAFAPTKGKTILRGGAGIFYERLPETVSQRRLLFDGMRVRELVIAGPSYPDPFAAGQVSLPPPSVVRLAPGLRAPYLFQAGFSVERELWRRTQLTVEYATLRGVHLLRSRNLNAPLTGTGLRPEPNFLNIKQVESSAILRSNALSVGFRGRLNKYFKGLAQYTLASTMDDTGGVFALPADNFDLRAEAGRADFDQRHRFNLAGTVELPWGFRVGSILALASPLPFDITTGFDDNRDTVANDRPPGVTRNTGRGPGLARLDLRVTKLFRLPRPFSHKDRQSENFDISVDLFNALNRTNFGNFVGLQSSPFFGRANSALPARTVQLSAKYSF